jgi:hypothetical protein
MIRYRIPADTLLLVFAGLALVTIGQALGRKLAPASA